MEDQESNMRLYYHPVTLNIINETALRSDINPFTIDVPAQHICVLFSYSLSPDK